MSDPTEVVLSRLNGVKTSGDGHAALCPAHDDRRQSLSITVGAQGQVLLKCHAGCLTGSVLKVLGLHYRDLWPENGNAHRSSVTPKSQGRKIVATYDYTDAGGVLAFQVVRFDPKEFRPRRPDGRGGWLWNLAGVTRVPYRLPEFVAAPPEWPVFIVEGEKDVDALSALGLVATTNPGGAGKWPEGFNEHFHGRRVVLLPDNDEAGEKHARKVAGELLGVAFNVKIVRLPDLPPKGDASDWLAAGGTAERLLEMAEQADAVLAFDPEEESPASPGVLLSEVEPEVVTWLWPNRIPFGKVTILDGDPGLGKSTLTLEIAARVSRGDPLPDGAAIDPAGVVILSQEDGLADTIRPRLEAAGAILERIIAVPTVPTLGGEETLPEIPRDLPAVERAIRHVNARLVIVDPLMAYLGGATNSFRDQDVRRALAPLAKLAEETGAAALVVRHLNKRSEGNPLYRGGGSIGIIGAARSGLLVARDPDDDSRRVLASLKSNLSVSAAALTFRLEATEAGVVRVIWLGTSAHTASALLAAPTGGEERTALEEAKGFLLEILEKGPVATTEVDKQRRRAQISEATFKRAKAALGIRSQRSGFGGDGNWFLALPAGANPQRRSNTPIGAHGNTMSTFGPDERLWESGRLEEGEIL